MVSNGQLVGIDFIRLNFQHRWNCTRQEYGLARALGGGGTVDDLLYVCKVGG